MKPNMVMNNNKGEYLNDNHLDWCKSIDFNLIINWICSQAQDRTGI